MINPVFSFYQRTDYAGFYNLTLFINKLNFPMSTINNYSLLCKPFLNHEFYELNELLFFEKLIKPQSGLEISPIRLIRGLKNSNCNLLIINPVFFDYFYLFEIIHFINHGKCKLINKSLMNCNHKTSKYPDQSKTNKYRIFDLYIKEKVMGLALSNKAIDKYFSFLTKLDNGSKKKLIIKLTESIELKENKEFDLKSLFGAWEDSKDSDDIIKEIKDSRTDKNNLAEF